MNSSEAFPAISVAATANVRQVGHTGNPAVAVLTGGGDKPYALGLAGALVAQGTSFHFIGSDEVSTPELREHPLVVFLNLRGDQRHNVSRREKAVRMLRYYARLIGYVGSDAPRVMHILWNNKVEFFDRTVLMLYYRARGKRLAFTAHNVNAARRDGKDSWFNRLTLRVQYQLAHRIFVHTAAMRQELQTDFNVSPDKISVIPFGLNSTVPNTNLSRALARQRLGLSERAKVLLFFGHIAPYKGLEFLIEALPLVVRAEPECRLLLVGQPKACPAYWQDIRTRIAEGRLKSYLVERIEFVPDEETEIFFKAADVLVLPYIHIFQSGVLSLAYNFGLPVIAADVGSLREDVVEGETGFLFPSRDPRALAGAIERFFLSDLYKNADDARARIKKYASERYSWTKVGAITRSVYTELENGSPHHAASSERHSHH